MANAPSRETLNFLMVGKTGVGKSSTGNTILNFKAFEANLGACSVTKICQADYGQVLGRNVKVVDGPGLADSNLSVEDDVKKIIEEAKTAVAETPDGYDAILTVIPFGRFSKGDKDLIRQLKAIFGDDYISQYGILLITHGDMFNTRENKDFDDWCAKQRGVFRELLDECGGRVLLFDNKSKDKRLKDKQLEKLLKMVEDMKTTARYLPDQFKAAQVQRDKLMLQQREPIIFDQTRRDMRLIMNKLDNINMEIPAEAISDLKILKTQALKLISDVKDQDEDTGVLKHVIGMLESVASTVSAKTDLVEATSVDIETDKENERRTAAMNVELDERKLEIQERKGDYEKKHEEMAQKYKAMMAQQVKMREKIKKPGNVSTRLPGWPSLMQILYLLISIAAIGLQGYIAVSSNEKVEKLRQEFKATEYNLQVKYKELKQDLQKEYEKRLETLKDQVNKLHNNLTEKFTEKETHLQTEWKKLEDAQNTSYQEHKSDLQQSYEDHQNKLQNKAEEINTGLQNSSQEHQNKLQIKVEELNSDLQNSFQEHKDNLQQKGQEQIESLKDSFEEYQNSLQNKVEKFNSSVEERAQEHQDNLQQNYTKLKDDLHEMHKKLESEVNKTITQMCTNVKNNLTKTYERQEDIATKAFVKSIGEMLEKSLCDMLQTDQMISKMKSILCACGHTQSQTDKQSHHREEESAKSSFVKGLFFWR